jgi:capsular polysaccharide biosynthesis protein
MEIIDYFRAIGRRFWVLVLVPLVAGLVPLAYFVVRPAQYAGRVLISPTALIGGGNADNQYTGSDAEKRFSNDVKAAVTTKRLIDQVAAETKVPAARVKSGLSIEQVAESSFMQLSYTTTHRSEAVPVVRATAENALRFLFQSQVELAHAQVDAAQKQVDKAENDLEALSRSVGGQSPDDAYAALSKGIASQEALAARTKDRTAAAQILRDVEARKAQLATLAGKQGEYLALADTRRKAISLREQSQETERRAAVQLAAAAPGKALIVGNVHRSFPYRLALEISVGSAAVALFFAVGYVFASEVWDGVRRRARVQVRPASAA